MKRVFLCILPAIALIMASCSTSATKTYTVKAESIVKPVVCYGAVVCSETVLQEAKGNIIIENVYVRAGDSVSKDTPLIEYRHNDGSNGTITASSDAIITAVSCKENDRCHNGQKLIEYYNMSKLNINAGINENDAAFVKKGQSVIISGTGFRNSTYSGTVEQISALADQSSSGVFLPCTIVIDSPDLSLIPGFTAKCEISVKIDNQIVVPQQSVGYRDGFYAVVVKNTKRVKTPVTIASSYKDRYIVSKGLSVNDKIVYDISDD